MQAIRFMLAIGVAGFAVSQAVAKSGEDTSANALIVNSQSDLRYSQDELLIAERRYTEDRKAESAKLGAAVSFGMVKGFRPNCRRGDSVTVPKDYTYVIRQVCDMSKSVVKLDDSVSCSTR